MAEAAQFEVRGDGVRSFPRLCDAVGHAKATCTSAMGRDVFLPDGRHYRRFYAERVWGEP